MLQNVREDRLWFSFFYFMHPHVLLYTISLLESVTTQQYKGQG
jgi:hypothetical protein